MSRPEAQIEARLRDAVRQRGGYALKFAPPGMRGWPDRIILMPHGRIYFVELKSPGKTPDAHQERRLGWLTSAGFNATVLDSREAVDAWVSTL